jgi:cytochrome c2
MTVRGLLCVVLLLSTACETKAAAALRLGTPGVERGRGALVYYGCGSCHQIPGVAHAVGHVGPSLDGIARRSYVAGRLRNEPEALIHFIRFPSSVNTDTAMPELGVSDSDARAMAAYLYTLR